ncbi:hypothetical protein AAFF_G00202910 [Aldrovandia affinis]|uniref:Uncharacterized protein n=1 Tax=Aldrovandia affinis TaxID=143900 RepID=A0AAD7WVA9_9TELE|nr:hypothetical protein AAFF_G00202910 [Aldrovandia affinis]
MPWQWRCLCFLSDGHEVVAFLQLTGQMLQFTQCLGTDGDNKQACKGARVRLGGDTGRIPPPLFMQRGEMVSTRIKGECGSVPPEMIPGTSAR